MVSMWQIRVIEADISFVPIVVVRVIIMTLMVVRSESGDRLHVVLPVEESEDEQLERYIYVVVIDLPCGRGSTSGRDGEDVQDDARREVC